MPVLVVGLIVIVVVLALFVRYWYIVLPIALVILIAILLPRVIRHFRKKRYFASDEFQTHKRQIASVVAEHNAVANYASEIRSAGSFRIGASSTGSQAHLATFENTSQRAYRRDRHVATYAPANVHNCSLQVVRNAAGDPLKYLTKYFDIKATAETIADVETLGESISRLEDAVLNLKQREGQIEQTIAPPAFILKYYLKEFMSQVGVELSPIVVPYPEYVFEYVSAGGNSSQKTRIELDSPTIDALIERLAEKVRFRQSAVGQRTLMTAKLRMFIKARDNFACRRCSLSTAMEPNLLLEVDHIMPVSRGGLSVVENLQTLCWRCNRSKSNKIFT